MAKIDSTKQAMVLGCFSMSKTEFLEKFKKNNSINSLEDFWENVRNLRSRNVNQVERNYPELNQFCINFLSDDKIEHLEEIKSKVIEDELNEESSLEDIKEKVIQTEPIIKVETIQQKPILVDDSKQLTGFDEIFMPKDSIISKLIKAVESGFSIEFISQHGREKGYLGKYMTPKEIEWRLKEKGFLKK